MPLQSLRIAVTAPACLPKPTQSLENACACLTQLGAKCIVGQSCVKPRDFTYADDYFRAAELQSFLADSSLDLVLCCRGGYGSARLLPYIDYTAVSVLHPVLCGFSDITALHSAFYTRCGKIGLHGPMAVTDFSEQPLPQTLQSFISACTERQAFLPIQTLQPICGSVRGILFGGNLCVLTSLCGTPYFAVPSNGILFLEEVHEPLYKIDRMLHQLRQNGVFQQVRAVVFGRMQGIALAEFKSLFANFFHLDSFPVGYGLPCGHQKRNMTLPIGGSAVLSAGTLQVCY